MRKLSAFFASMTGRVFLILLIGVSLSAAVAWGLTDVKRRGDLRRLDLERSVDRAEDVITQWRGAPAATRNAFVPARNRGVAPAPEALAGAVDDPAFRRQLDARLPSSIAITALRGGPDACRSAERAGRGFGANGFGGGRGGRNGGGRPGDAGRNGGGRPDTWQVCWLVTATTGAERLAFVVQTPPRPTGAPILFDPLYVAILIVAAGVLAFFVARMAAAPIRRLSRAATELGDDLTRKPLPIIGSSELRSAAEAFNAMQARLQRQLAERTHMLAAITHDLQTPVTRLRLRLEKVQDGELRERLLGDLAAMQTLIREGLDLARSTERAEDRVLTDLQSLVDSIVDDAADAGQAVTTGERLEVDVMLQPEGMRRCLSNLIDNALKYGGSAQVSLAKVGGKPVVIVADNGPGMSEADLEAVFQPFVRLEDSRSRETGGAGLGLTIARTLAERSGAGLTLRNRAGGGLEAVVQFR